MFKPLRDKILELAITGKLVPQMDSEPAVEQIGPAPAKEEEPFAGRGTFCSARKVEVGAA